MKPLRTYQVRFVNGIYRALRAVPAVIGVAPTGSGKTRCGAEMALDSYKHGRSMIWVTHRDTLLQQTSAAFTELGIPHGLLSGDVKRGGHLPIQIATVQTLVNNLGVYDPNLLTFDEAHLSMARSWRRVRERWQGAKLVGLSATPTRLSGESFADMYGEMVIGPSVAELIELGNLCRYRAFAPFLPDLSGIDKVNGELDQAQLAAYYDKSAIYGDVVSCWKSNASDRLTLGFAINRIHAEVVAEKFRRAGVPAESITGAVSKKEQRARLARFGPKTRVAISCQLFTEGFDRPEISCILDLAHTESLAKHIQKIGRGLRPAPWADKQDCLLYDFAGNIVDIVHQIKHGFPDDEREWKLDMGKRGKDVFRLPSDKLPRVCPKCKALIKNPTVRVCVCGYTFSDAVIAREEKKEIDADVIEINRLNVKHGGVDDPGVSFIIKQVIDKGWDKRAIGHRMQELFTAREAWAAKFGSVPELAMSAHSMQRYLVQDKSSEL